MEIAQFVFMAIGGLATLVGLVFGLGRVFGRQQARENVEAGEVLKMGLEMAVIQEKLTTLSDDIHELDKADILSTQKLKTLEGQTKILFELLNKQGEKLENFFNKMYDLKVSK